VSKPDRQTPDINTLFYGRFYNANPPPPYPTPPPPPSFFQASARNARVPRPEAPPGYRWVLIAVEDIDPR
jgi:hypothetical protein